MKKNLIIASLLCAFSSSWAQEETQITEQSNGILVMQTSRPHIQPQLMTLQTAQVLESYGLGFSGSGNIHNTLANWNKYPLRGSIILGLGDVLELGYGMHEFRTTNQERPERLMKGHLKIQLLNAENPMSPKVAFSYGQNLEEDFKSADGKDYTLERMQGELLATWSAGNQETNISFHPGLQFSQDNITKIGDEKQKGLSKMSINPQLGVTWQTKEKIVYMLEGRLHNILKDSSFSLKTKPSYETAIDANLGARFFFKNWIFMDAGLRYSYLTEQKVGKPEIHANFTGVIPLKTVFVRSKNLKD